jgi:hypothetical protein
MTVQRILKAEGVVKVRPIHRIGRLGAELHLDPLGYGKLAEQAGAMTCRSL